jgi:spore photoproduct lyase
MAHGGHTIISWSLNPERVIHSEEHKSASLAERISAARQCQEWGYPVGFHFEEIVAVNHPSDYLAHVIGFAHVGRDNVFQPST